MREKSVGKAPLPYLQDRHHRYSRSRGEVLRRYERNGQEQLFS